MPSLLWVVLGTWVLLQAASVFCVFMYWRYVPAAGVPARAGRARVIVPVRGAGAGLARFLRSLDGQAYRDWQAVFVVEDGADPAWPVLSAYAAQRPGRAQVEVAGLAADEGQKVHNLRAGLACVAPDDRYIVFADADGELPPHFLGRLLFPLERGRCDIATSYRLIHPADERAGSLLAAAVNLQVATFARYRPWNVPWGGGTAMTQATCRRLALADSWRGVLSDDLWLARLARREGLHIRMQRDVLVASPARMGLAQCLAFGVRQYRHAWLSRRRLWLVAAAFLGAQALGWLAWAATLAVDPRAAFWALAAAYAASWARAVLRAGIIVRIHGREGLQRMRPALWLDMAAPFVAVLAHAAMVAVAAGSRRIRWAGCEYWLRRGRVVRMARDAGPQAHVPASGVPPA